LAQGQHLREFCVTAGAATEAVLLGGRASPFPRKTTHTKMETRKLKFNLSDANQ